MVFERTIYYLVPKLPVTMPICFCANVKINLHLCRRFTFLLTKNTKNNGNKVFRNPDRKESGGSICW